VSGRRPSRRLPPVPAEIKPLDQDRLHRPTNGEFYGRYEDRRGTRFEAKFGIRWVLTVISICLSGYTAVLHVAESPPAPADDKPLIMAIEKFVEAIRQINEEQVAAEATPKRSRPIQTRSKKKPSPPTGRVFVDAPFLEGIPVK